MRMPIIQSPDGIQSDGAEWGRFAEEVSKAHTDVLLTNEMPFGAWAATSGTFKPERAANWATEHECGVAALRALPTPVILSSRPVPAAGKLANEGFALVRGEYVRVHHKHFFPDEPGWWEESWFKPAAPGFDVVDVGGVRVGFLLCTELFFNEWARHYRRQSADVIAVPRASGTSVFQWKVAARMAAIVSGAYVISSNRVGGANPVFGGRGFAVDPDGELIAETSERSPVISIDLDLRRVAQRRLEYPCYVPELNIETIPRARTAF